eukprot:3389828-Rhodomonas_salina.2
MDGLRERGRKGGREGRREGGRGNGDQGRGCRQGTRPCLRDTPSTSALPSYASALLSSMPASTSQALALQSHLASLPHKCQYASALPTFAAAFSLKTQKHSKHGQKEEEKTNLRQGAQRT